MTMLSEKFINSDCFNCSIDQKVDLFIIDPPYGKIISDDYDQLDSEQMIELLYRLLSWCEKWSIAGTSAYIFGGIGTYRNRPFLRFLSELESKTEWHINDIITWKKRRGYGKQNSYLFTREEIVFLVYGQKKPKTFNVPYTEESRSEEWKKRLHRSGHKLPKNEDNLRRSNVWTDINEIFSQKRVVAEKPEKLYEVIIEASSNAGDLICDPMCGSGTTGVVASRLNRNFICIEKDPATFDIATKRFDEWRGILYAEKNRK